MCIRIAVADHLSRIAVWDPDEVMILVRLDAHPHDVLREMHALLTIDLGVPTTPGAGLSCFCGDPIDVTELLAGAVTIAHRGA